MTYSNLPSPVRIEAQADVQISIRTALRSIWLHPRSTLSGLAYAGPWSWIGPIGLALLVFYARIFALALLRDPFLNGALLGGAVGILVGWPLCSLLLYGLSRLIGGRPSFMILLVLCAWTTLPFTLRNAVQVIYMLGAGRLLAQPGLTGLLTGMDASDWTVRAGQLLLGRMDLFMFWHLGLLASAVSVGAHSSMAKALVVVCLYAVLILLFASSIVFV